MISLSIYCSTQTISVALFKENKLLKILQEKIVDNKIDKLPLMVQRILSLKKAPFLDVIIFSKGPGSYTVNRSIKALTQGLSLAGNSKLVTLDSFQIYLGNIDNNFNRVVVFFKDYNDKYFTKIFLNKNQKYRELKKEFLHLDKISLEKLILNELQSNPSTLFVTSSYNQREKYQKKIKNIKLITPNAKYLAKSFFNGYGDKNLDLIYHHTYYSL